MRLTTKRRIINYAMAVIVGLMWLLVIATAVDLFAQDCDPHAQSQAQSQILKEPETGN